jgi:hypothetical protein
MNNMMGGKRIDEPDTKPLAPISEQLDQLKGGITDLKDLISKIRDRYQPAWIHLPPPPDGTQKEPEQPMCELAHELKNCVYGVHGCIYLLRELLEQCEL